jgi:hypothetical protein
MEIQTADNKKVAGSEIISVLRNTGAIEINQKEL